MARIVLALLLGMILLPPSSAQAAVSSFQQDTGGYNGTQDTYVDQGSPGTAQGTSSTVVLDTGPSQQGLVRFDNIFGSGADQIPFGATINSASLTVDVTNNGSSSAQIRFHRMLVNWPETATWNSMFGGIQTDDAEAMSAFDAQVPNPAGSGSQTITGLAAALQAWSDGASNFGWAIISNSSDGWDFRSSETGTVADRPLLTVDWSPPSSDLTLTVTDTPDPAPLGGPLLYTLLVTNNGPSTATGVTVTDTLPASVTLVSATPTQGSCSGTGTVICDLGSILNSGTASIEILVTANVSGIITNNATVAANEADPVPADNSTSVDTEIVVGGSTDVPLTQVSRMHGFLDYTVTGGSLRTGDGGSQACDIAASSAANLSGIPATATVRAAYLYWAASGLTVDANVTLDGSPLTADRSFEADYVLGNKHHEYFTGIKDVTAQVTVKRNGLYTFSGLTVATGNPWCSSKAVVGGWSLYVIFEDTALSGKTLVLYDGLDLERNGSTDYLLSGIYASGPPEAKTTMLLWEGDIGLGGGTEQLLFNGSALSDVLNPVDNVYNSTINSLGVSTSYGLDLDTFDVSALVAVDDTLATTQVDTGPDLVLLNSVLLQVKTNIIAGTVFEDVNYGGGPGRDLATAVAAAPAFAVPRPGATVELYDAGGNFLRTTATDANGDYGFTGLPDGGYTVRVVNETVTSSRPGATGTEWPVQTFRTDASGATVTAVTNEVGGSDPTVQDDPANTGALNLSAITAQSLAPVTISASIAKVQVDFGYNFDTIVNTNNAGQGSLREFIDNSNALTNSNLAQGGFPAGTEHSLFMIPSATDPLGRTQDPGFDVGSGVALITLATALPALTDADTSIDGSTQTANIGNTNTSLLGTGGTVGVEALPLAQVAGPEVEIRDGGALTIGLRLQANDITVRGLAILGFGAANGEGAIIIDDAVINTLIENNVLGSSAASFTDPGAALRNYAGVESTGGDTGAILNNLIGFGHRGVFLNNGSNSWIVNGNEIRNHDIASTDGDGIAISDSTSNSVTGNLITGSSSQGFVVTNGSGSTLTNTTLTGNGVGSSTDVAQSAAITLRSGTSSNTIDRNIVQGNYGAGLQVNDGATGTTITRNSFANNGAVAARSTLTLTGQIGIDLNVFGDDSNLGTPDYFSVNDQADTLQDFPILDTAAISGGNLTLTGWSKPGATIEVFIAAADPLGFGEGETYLGTFVEGVADADTDVTLYSGLINGLDQGSDTTNRFSFTVPTPAGVVDGTVLTATATVGANTSEFSGNVTAAVVSDVSGIVFEDIDGNVLDGAESIGDAANPVVSGVDVYLYLDDGSTPGSPDATDTIQNGGAPVSTDGSGVFTFSGISGGTYWVAVDSRTVSPAAGVHPSYLATTPWAEQTYGPDKGLCADGTGGTAERAGAGPCFGGLDGANDDDISALTSSEHVSRVVVSGGAVSNVDFGFSYNVVTNVEPAGNGSLTASTYQGSIDQFVRNANSINGPNAMRFVPAIPTNASGGGGAWWRVDYTGSISGETISNTHDADTTIDGTAFDLVDGISPRNTNPGNLGANAGGGVTVGVDDLALPQAVKPELEVMRSDSAVGVAFYFYSNGLTSQIPNNFTVRNVATWGFVGGVGMTGIAGMRPTGVMVERNVIGSPPSTFTDPAVAGTLRGVALLSADGATIRDNLIGFVDANGVTASDVTSTTVNGNEIREAGQVDNVADGVNYGGTSTTGTITANLIVDSGGMGIDGTATGNVIENNTVTGSGQLGVQVAGIRQTGSANTIRRNIVTGNAGPGVLVPDTANAIAITENHFGSNGSIAIDSVEAGGDTGTGDGIMLNDGALDAADGNDGLDYPVIDSAVLSGGNLTVTGFARAGVEIEFYESVGAANDNNASGSPHGEGVVYLFTSTEGAADADATTGASYTDPGYGTDPDVNRFSFTVAAPAGLAIGDEISAVAYLAADGTSEFGPNFVVTGSTTTIAGTIFVDAAGDGLADGPIGPAPNAFESGARVELYRAGPDGNADGGDDSYIGFTTSSAVDGSYSFTGLSPDIYYVTVDSHGVDDGPYNGAYTAIDTWAEQTYGPVGAASFDGVSTWTYAAAAGAFYGGAQWDVSDNHVPANSLPTAEHIARIDTTGGDVSDVDFGFSFNVVTTTRGGSSAQDPGAGGGQRTVQGSLRQFITNANAQSGANAMRFVPAAPSNATLGGNSWWRAAITAQLPNVEDAATTIDGSAYDPANGVAPVNTNTAAIGSGSAVGVAGAFNTPLLDPELEIQGDNIVNNGFFVLAAADNSAIRNLAITSFVQAGIRPVGSSPDMLDALVIENNVIGTSPASFTDNPALFVGRAIVARDLDNSTIRNNLVGWTGWGMQLDFDNEDTLIETNEIRGVDTWGLYLRGVASTSQQPERLTVQGNLVENNGNDGIYTTESLGDFVISQNTVRFNATGVRLWGANNSVSGNVISDNTGTGLLLTGDGLPSYPAPSANLLSQNNFGNNSLLGIDLVETGINQDGVTLNDAGDPDLGANGLLNYPIIESAQIAGPNLIVNGFAAPGMNVEFYIADADPTGFGEGQTYLFSAVEGSGADTDAASGSYGPGPINGVAQGTDTTNRFEFIVPVPGGVGVGTSLTATGTIGNATSEFSGRAPVGDNADLVITKVLDPSTPGPFAEGDAVTYLLTVTNNGPAQATNVTATDTYPAELTLGVPVPSAPTTYAAGTGVWSIGTLNSGASATLTLPGTVNAGTAGSTVTNSVTAASGDQADLTTVGDDLVETFTVLPFLSITDVVQAETDSVPGTTTFTFTVSINQAIGADVTFDFDTADNTATTADGDYVAIAGGSGTILAGDTSTTIDVTVNGDDAIEADETFFVNLSNAVGAAISDGQGQGTISNDDGATVSVAATTNANEAGPIDGQFTVTQSTTSASDTVISYTVAGTATPGGIDYASLSGSVTVLAGATTATIDVTGVVADLLIEGTETVIVTLTGTDDPGIAVAASPADSATISVIDADTANVSIAATGDASEAGPTDGQFTVTQSVSSITDTVVTYTVAGTATPGGTDYASLSGTVTILAGDTAATIDVTGVVADALVEGTETVIVTLTATDNPGIAVAASPADTATVNILDNSGANVSIAGTATANEAGPVDGQFTVTQSTTSASDTVISYTVAGTATPGGIDYATLTGTATVAAGATTATIDVTGIVADGLVEGTETVVVTLTGTDNAAIAVAASPADTATVDILDGDSATVSIAATTSGSESGPVDGLFTVTQSAPTISDTVISYVVAGTATGGSDYTALSGTVTVPGGATTATIIVPVIDDAIAEGIDETVDITLSSMTAGDPGVSIAASPADSASLTIADNDSDLVTTKTVSNSAPLEGDSITYTITVSNSPGVQATNVSLTDTLPAGVTYASDDSGGAYDSSSGVWSIGTLDPAAPNNIATLNITATVDAGAGSLPQPIVNTTTAATGDQADPDTSTDTLSAGITVDANADLVTTKTVDNPSPVETATVVYTLSVLNNGAAQATNVSLIDLLPAGVTYVSDDSGGAYNPVTGSWLIGTIDDGGVATLNISATVDAGAGTLPQPITNTSTAATGDQPDPDTTTDDLTEDITVNYNANLVTTKSVDTGTPQVGDTIVYTLTTTNNGPAPATNVSLTDTLPAGVTYVSDDGAGAYDSVTGVWTIGSLANGAVATLNITATVDDGAGLLPQPITNTTTAAIADQFDPDTSADDLAADIIVNLIDPDLIQLNKTAGRSRANVGEIVAYSIEVRNTTANPIGNVRINDSPARGFKYVPGSAQLDGLPTADPAGGFPLEFDIGVLPGFVDGNANGVADPGEPGYAVLSYRMVAGAGVAPGVWTNTAIATATCSTCFVSNIATADIEIIEDTLFDLGTIIGKVFYDGDEDGWQDSGEAGIEAAMVALDDGTYALTDRFGRYHFPAVKPGQRLLKINLNSLPGQAKATNSKTRIVSVTPGLLAKANFGVIVDTVDAAIGSDGELGIPVESETTHAPILINGSTLMPSLLVNGEPVSLAAADVRLGTLEVEDVVELSNGKLKKPIRFSTRAQTDATIKRWKLVVSGPQDEATKTWKGSGSPPEFIEWDGVRKNGRLINSGGVYSYYLEVKTDDGQSVSSGRRLFGVNRLNSISLNLAGGAFVTGKHELTEKAKALLSKTARAIREYPDEIVVISGHTDSVGSDASNMALAERRARSAYDYLTTAEGLPKEQFVIQAFGESRPIANNDTEWGRELNRRVEINGEFSSVDRARNYDPYRQAPLVRIESTDLSVDDSGAFRASIDLEGAQDTMKVLLGTPQGGKVETVVRLPTLKVISPQGRIAIPIDRDRPGKAGSDTDENRPLLTTELLGSTEPGNIVEFNGEVVDVDDNGLFLAPLPIRAGENYFGLVARKPTGMLRVANVKLTLDEASIDEPEFVVEPIPQLALQLPPPGIPMTNSNLVIPGTTVPGNRVFINDREIEVGADGSFTTAVEFQLGENLVTVRVVDPDGHSGQIEQAFEYNGDPVFFMALVDGTFSKLETSGNLQAAGKSKRSEVVSEGRVAYYLKGHVLGKYLLTSAFDSGQQELGDIFSDLTAQDNDRLLTNLDPDTLYPVYGDSSTLVYDAQSQSKFYLALESETVTALIGNYALNFTDTELAGYQRTLYGASATFQSAAKDESGVSRTQAQAFYANIEQAHVRDELRATGGSLYYLSQREVIEGSEHISVIVRDQDSGLILRRTALQQGLDYSIDYVDGRLLTNRPISSFTADYSLIESDLLGGSAVYLQVDYETRLDGFEQTASGGRIRQAIGERLAVGVTSVDEDQLGGQYSLQGADAEYKLGKNSRLIAEYASSEGNNSTVNISEDGGLSYQAVAQAAGSSGDAYKIAAELDVGEWFGFENRLLLNTYFKNLDTGFSANSVSSEQGSEKSGVSASWKINDSSSLLGRFERQTQLIDGSENTLGTLQWNLVRNQWGLAAELEEREGYAGDATMAAMRMNYRWSDALSTYLLHQQTLEGMDNDQSTVGVAYRATDALTLDASATRGTRGDSAQLGAQLEWRGNRLYVAQQLSDLDETGLSNRRLVGVEAPFGPNGAVYSEYHWSRLPLGRQRQALIGARQRFQATEGLRIDVSGEHSAENATSLNTGERYALSIGATYDNDNGITLSTRNEYRKDSRSIASEQFLSTVHMRLALGDDLAVLGKYRFSKSETSAAVNRDIDFTEASVGLAYRPVEHDRLNLLTRFTRLTNTPTEFQSASTVTGLTSDIFAVDWSYQLSQRIEWVGKQAMRWSESDEDASELRSRTSLTVQRLNWSMPMDLRFGTEYRLMDQNIADDRRSGFVTELMWEGLDPLILGLGYNFSDVSDNEYVDYDFSTKGPFFRLQGKF